MSLKVGILTLYYDNKNYGGLLQAYALQHYLEQSGVDSEQICYRNDFSEAAFYKQNIKDSTGIAKVKKTVRFVQFLLRSGLNSVMNLRIKGKIAVRDKAFYRFQNAVPHSERVYDKSSIKESLKKYSAFVCGSDVIWNAGIPAYISCLGFVPDGMKKVAYAPSLGTSVPPEWWLKEYKPFLEKLDAVSVREQSINDYISGKIPKLGVKTMPDPTFLLTSADWNNTIAKIHPKVSGKYMLCYLLGDSIAQRQGIKALAEKNGLKIVTFPFIADGKYRKCDSDFGDHKLFDVSPSEFLSLIKNSEIVVTDSFHAVVFSLIFHKNFRAVNRMNKNSSGMSGRITNLLKAVGLSDFFVENNAEIAKNNITVKIDFENADKAVEAMRAEGQKYLKDSLGL